MPDESYQFKLFQGELTRRVEFHVVATSREEAEKIIKAQGWKIWNDGDCGPETQEFWVSRLGHPTLRKMNPKTGGNRELPYNAEGVEEKSIGEWAEEIVEKTVDQDELEAQGQDRMRLSEDQIKPGRLR
jgi:hypothetical protein